MTGETSAVVDWVTRDGAALLREMAGAADGGLTSLSVELGRRAVESMMNAEVNALVGDGSSIVRYGTTRGVVRIAGQRVTVTRPRVRDRAANAEIRLESYRQATASDLMSSTVMRRVLAGVPTRKVASTLDTPGARTSRGTSRSAVSRHIVSHTAQDLETVNTRPLDGVHLAALMLDGLGVGGETLIVAVGVTHDGEKIALGVVNGPTESKPLAVRLLRSLVARGLNVSRGVLVVLDGGKALASAVRKVLGAAASIQRCREHKIRNVTDNVPVAMRHALGNRLRNAYAQTDYAAARATLDAITAELAKSHPAAAKSLREGLELTLTVTRLGVQRQLGASLGSTNIVENMIHLIRDATRRVKRWQSNEMRLRWTATGLLAAQAQMDALPTAGLPHLVRALVPVQPRHVARSRPGLRISRTAAVSSTRTAGRPSTNAHPTPAGPRVHRCARAGHPARARQRRPLALA